VRASVNSAASDEEWQEMANVKSADDWESSLQEEGNEESQILIPKIVSEENKNDGEEGEEPKLMLF